MNFPFYIAKRYLLSKKSHNAINIISGVSVCGVAIATAALVCILSVFNGFQDMVAGLFTAMDPQLKVVPAVGKFMTADAKELKANGCWCCCEVSNMGCQPGAIHYFQHNGVLFAPGKAVNAGGVATSGLEMTQNAEHLSWKAEEVDDRLHHIMQSIHEQCVKFGRQADGHIDYVKGANIAGFMKVAQAMLEQGII